MGGGSSPCTCPCWSRPTPPPWPAMWYAPGRSGTPVAPTRRRAAPTRRSPAGRPTTAPSSGWRSAGRIRRWRTPWSGRRLRRPSRWRSTSLPLMPSTSASIRVRRWRTRVCWPSRRAWTTASSRGWCALSCATTRGAGPSSTPWCAPCTPMGRIGRCRCCWVLRGVTRWRASRPRPPPWRRRRPPNGGGAPRSWRTAPSRPRVSTPTACCACPTGSASSPAG